MDLLIICCIMFESNLFNDNEGTAATPNNCFIIGAITSAPKTNGIGFGIPLKGAFEIILNVNNNNNNGGASRAPNTTKFYSTM